MTARTVDLLEIVLRTTHRIAGELGPEDLDRPTPCDELDVRGLLEHVIGWQQVSGACAAEREPPLSDGSPTYRASPDVTGDLRTASAVLVTNLRNRSDDTITMPYRGATPMAVMQAELIAESVIHTWDLAASVGVAVTFDDEVLSVAHEGLSLMLGESFAEMGFRSPETAEPPAGELERLLVRSGRSPGSWPLV